MKTTQGVTCPLPGLDGVTVEYNMMAPMTAYDSFVSSSGREAFDVVVKTIEGWPEKEYPGGPQGLGAPMAWRLWLTRTGVGAAAQAWVQDPN